MVERLRKHTLREKASFFRILLAEQLRQFFAIPFKLTLLVLVLILQTSSWVTQLVWLDTAASIAFWYLVINIGINTLRVLSVRYYLRRKHLPSVHKDNFTTGLQRVSTLLAHILFFFALLHLLGIQITQFFTTISLVAVAIVLIFRDYLANFLAGIVTLFSDDIKLGDVIEVSSQRGVVVDITLLHVQLETDAGDIVFVPNTTISTKEVVNFSKRKQKIVFYEYALPTSLLGKQKTVEQRIMRELKQVLPDALRHDEVTVSADKIEKDAVMFLVRIPFSSYSRQSERLAKNAVASQVLAIRSKAK